MPFRDLVLLLAICLIWAVNSVLSKLVIADLGAPPFLYTAARFAVIAAFTWPWLWPAPRPLWRMIAVGLLLGAANFSLNYIGLKTGSPSDLAIISQLGVPMTTLLSVFMLGERLGRRRAVGMVLTLAGGLAVMWNPNALGLSLGAVLFAIAAFAAALGAVMLKQVEGARPVQFQAWVGFSSLWPMLALSAGLEKGQADFVLGPHAPVFLAAALFSGLVVSVFAHTAYYHLIQSHEVNLLQPLTLISPLMTVALGVAITHDPLTLQMVIGAAVALLGVLVILAPPPRRVTAMFAALRG
jgi:drug/metabolite transporter (DMT)-like permease